MNTVELEKSPSENVDATLAQLKDRGVHGLENPSHQLAAALSLTFHPDMKELGENFSIKDYLEQTKRIAQMFTSAEADQDEIRLTLTRFPTGGSVDRELVNALQIPENAQRKYNYHHIRAQLILQEARAMALLNGQNIHLDMMISQGVRAQDISKTIQIIQKALELHERHRGESVVPAGELINAVAHGELKQVTEFYPRSRFKGRRRNLAVTTATGILVTAIAASCSMGYGTGEIPLSATGTPQFEAAEVFGDVDWTGTVVRVENSRIAAMTTVSEESEAFSGYVSQNGTIFYTKDRVYEFESINLQDQATQQILAEKAIILQVIDISGSEEEVMIELLLTGERTLPDGTVEYDLTMADGTMTGNKVIVKGKRVYLHLVDTSAANSEGSDQILGPRVTGSILPTAVPTRSPDVAIKYIKQSSVMTATPEGEQTGATATPTKKPATTPTKTKEPAPTVDPNMPPDATGKDGQGYYKDVTEGTEVVRYHFVSLKYFEGNVVYKGWSNSEIDGGSMLNGEGVPLFKSGDFHDIEFDDTMPFGLSSSASIGLLVPTFRQVNYPVNPDVIHLTRAIWPEIFNHRRDNSISRPDLLFAILDRDSTKADFPFTTPDGIVHHWKLYEGYQFNWISWDEMEKLGQYWETTDELDKTLIYRWTVFADMQGRLIAVGAVEHPEDLTEDDARQVFELTFHPMLEVIKNEELPAEIKGWHVSTVPSNITSPLLKPGISIIELDFGQ